MTSRSLLVWRAQAPFRLAYHGATLKSLAKLAGLNAGVFRGHMPSGDSVEKVAAALEVDSIWLHDAWLSWSAWKPEEK